MQTTYRPTLDGLTAGSFEMLRLSGRRNQWLQFGIVLVVAAPVGLLIGQWLFALYSLIIGLWLLRYCTQPSALRRSLRQSLFLDSDTTLDITDGGMRMTMSTAVSDVVWPHFSAWAEIREGLVLVHALQPINFSFIPAPALIPGLIDTVAAHVSRHPKARDVRP